MNTTFKSPQSAITDVTDVSNIGLPGGLDAQTPLLMLPVNIETRFMSSGDTNELWVRIYPDQIAINSHEPELTTQEIADGQSYWNTVWAADLPSPTLDAVQAPWRGLASSLWRTPSRMDRYTDDAHQPVIAANSQHTRRIYTNSPAGLSNAAYPRQFMAEDCFRRRTPVRSDTRSGLRSD